MNCRQLKRRLFASIGLRLSCGGLLLLLAACASSGLPHEEVASSAPSKPAADPVAVFDALWNTFHEKYAFFALRGLDWQRQGRSFRARVTTDTSPDELYNLLCEMLQPLGDGHVTLDRGDDDEFSADFPTPFYEEFDDDADIERLFEISALTLSRAGFAALTEQAEVLEYSRSPKLGYLRIKEFEGVPVARIAEALDQILFEFRGVRGLIIDVRNNPGGEDSVAYAIANRFVPAKRVGHIKISKIGAGPDDFGPSETWFLEPKGSKPFLAPIALLVNDSACSAAEVFALAMGHLPQVTIVGNRTNGIFSDMFDAELPNGWELTLSDQKYFSAKGVCYERYGVPVDHKVLNTKADLRSKTDSVITVALDLLAKTVP